MRLARSATITPKPRTEKWDGIRSGRIAANFRYWRMMPVAPTAAFRRTLPVPSPTRESVLRVELSPLSPDRACRSRRQARVDEAQITATKPRWPHGRPKIVGRLERQRRRELRPVGFFRARDQSKNIMKKPPGGVANERSVRIITAASWKPARHAISFPIPSVVKFPLTFGPAV